MSGEDLTRRFFKGAGRDCPAMKGEKGGRGRVASSFLNYFFPLSKVGKFPQFTPYFPEFANPGKRPFLAFLRGSGENVGYPSRLHPNFCKCMKDNALRKPSFWGNRAFKRKETGRGRGGEGKGRQG